MVKKSMGEKMERFYRRPERKSRGEKIWAEK
jgi:hypothetical protein